MTRKAMMLAVWSAAVLAAGCTDAERTDGAAVDSLGAEGALGVPAGAQTAEPLPADDADIGTVTATLAEWTVTLSRDSVPAGAIAFDVSNTGTVEHRFRIEGNGEEWETENLAPGSDITMSVSLPPGEYRVFCSISDAGTNHNPGDPTVLRVY